MSIEVAQRRKQHMENDYNDKVSRVLNLYQRFMDGEVINKNIEAERV